MRQLLTEFRTSLGFLTRIPAGDLSGSDPGRSLYWFPVVGLLIGGFTVAIGLGCQALFPAPVHLIAVLVSAAILTGGLHLDGLADTFDGHCSWRTPEQNRRIMKDSRVGTMGVLALLFVLMLKLACLHGLGPYWWMGALLAPVWGRWAAFYGLHTFSPATSEGLAGRIGRGTRLQFRLATGFTIICSAVILVACEFEWPQVIALCLAPLPLVHLMIRRLIRPAGGITGDICGAATELTELLVILALSSQVFR